MELDSLDALQLALWAKAVGGTSRAAAFVVGLIERRVRLLGLDGIEVTRPASSCLVPDS
jgi:hypothetical protein